jgi:hypothetical protein
MGDTLTKITAEDARRILSGLISDHGDSVVFDDWDVWVEVDSDHGHVIEFTVWTTDEEDDDVELGAFVVTVR